MVPVITNNLDAIKDVCKKHHVRSLYLFGSALNDALFTVDSDVDLLYEIDLNSFQESVNYDYIDNLDDLEFSLKQLLSRKIDLVPYKNIHNHHFKKAVDNSRQLIYGN